MKTKQTFICGAADTTAATEVSVFRCYVPVPESAPELLHALAGFQPVYTE